MKQIKPGQRYKHFKGGKYTIVDVARDSETMEEVVVYKGKYNSSEFGPNPVWVRPVDNFCGQKEIDGKIIERYELIEDTE